MKKPIKWLALGVSLSALTHSIGQDTNNLPLNNDNLPQSQREVLNNNLTEQDPHLQIALDAIKIASDTTIPFIERLTALEQVHKFTQYASQICLSIAQGSAVDSKTRVHTAQMLKNIPGFAQQVGQIHLSIAQDSAVDVLSRLDAAKILKDMPDFAQQAGQAYLNIAQDSAINVLSRLDAAKILKDMPDFAQQAGQAYLSIAQDSTVASWMRLDVARILKYIPGFTQQVGQIHLSIAQDPAVHISTRLDAAKILKDMPVFDQQAGEAYLSIAQDPAVEIRIRLDAAKILKDIPEFAQQVAQICLSIVQDPAVDLRKRFDAARILKDTPEFAQHAGQAYLSIAQDPAVDLEDRIIAARILKDRLGFAQQAGQAYLSIAEDPAVEIWIRLDAAQILLSANNASFSPQVIETVKEIFQVCNSSQADEFLEVLGNDLGEDHPTVQDLIAVWIAIERQDDPKSPLAVYKEIMRKREETVSHHPVQIRLANQDVTLSASVMTYPEESIKALSIVNQNTVAILKKYLLEDCQNHQEEAQYLLDTQNIEGLMGVLESPFIQGFLSKKPTSVLGNKVHILLDKILDEYLNQNNANALSDASKLFLQLLVNVQTCPTGKEDGVEHTYRLLSADKVIEEDGLTNLRLQDEIKKFITDQFTKEKEVAVLDLVQNVTGDRDPHNIKYIKSLIGDAIGLYPITEKPTIDWNAGYVSQKIRPLSRQDALQLFYGYFRVDHLIRKTQDLFNDKKICFDGESKKDVSWAVINATLNNITVDGVIEGTDRINRDYFAWADEDTPLGITPVGALKILDLLGFVQVLNQ